MNFLWFNKLLYLNIVLKQDLVTYCAKDTIATQEVFSALWPKFLDRFPHPVSFAGMLEMGSAYLPVDRSWENYIRDADDTYEDLEKEMKCSLMKLADDSCNYLHGKRFVRGCLHGGRKILALGSS